MLRKIACFVLGVFMMLNLCGCFILLAGAAGGAGTSVWLQGKLSEKVDASFEKSIKAVESALKSLKFEVGRKVVKGEVAQIRSTYSDGSHIWIDVHKGSSASSTIDVRVSATGNKDASEKILDRIKRYL